MDPDEQEFLDRVAPAEYDEPSDDEVQGCASCEYNPDFCGCGEYSHPLDDPFWAEALRDRPDDR